MNKFILYLLLIIGGGLLQLWVVGAVLFFSNKPYTFEMLLRDGGLFFFASSLIISSIFTYWEKCDVTTNLNIVSFSAVFIFVLDVVIYVNGFKDALDSNSDPIFIGNYYLAQLCLAALSIVYSVIIEAHHGSFSKKKITNHY